MLNNLLHIVLSFALVGQTTVSSTASLAGTCEGPPSEACEAALADSYDRLSLRCLSLLTQEMEQPDLMQDDKLHEELVVPLPLLISVVFAVGAVVGGGLVYLISR